MQVKTMMFIIPVSRSTMHNASIQYLGEVHA